MMIMVKISNKSKVVLMDEISNRTLATLLVIAIVISVAGTLISLQKIDGNRITGHATDVEDGADDTKTSPAPITGDAVKDCENPTEEQKQSGVCPVKE